MTRIIAHIDMDSFFASCEEVCNPDLRRVPLAVCGRHERGVVTAANKIAKVRYGIKTGMSGWEARRILEGVPGMPCLIPIVPQEREHYNSPVVKKMR